MDKEALELLLPSMLLGTAVGKVLIKKGLITPEELLAELDEFGTSKDSPINDAVRDAKRAVAKW